MSNRVEPPSKSVDSLGAGDSGVSQLKGLFTLFAPIFIWSYAVPFFCSLLFTRERVMAPKNAGHVAKPPPVVGPDGIETGYIGPDVEMHEVDADASWPEFFFRIFLSCSFLFLFMLLSLYFGQEGMLYVPGSPIAQIEQNPERY